MVKYHLPTVAAAGPSTGGEKCVLPSGKPFPSMLLMVGFPARQRLAVLVLGLVLAACGTRVPPLARLDNDAIVVAFGNSITYGTGAEPGESYPAQLEMLIGRRVVNAGVPGELSADGERRLESVLDRYQPALLLLCHAGNDLLRRIDPQQAEAHLRAMIRLARSRGVQVVLIAVPRPGLLLKPAPFYRDLAEEFAIPIEENVLPDVLSNRDLKSDTVHPNAAGYRKVAEGVSALLRQAGAVE
jgi:acyl-CoA thioesterase-1